MSLKLDHIHIRPANNGYILSIDFEETEEYEHYDSETFIFLTWDEVVKFMVDPFDVVESTAEAKKENK
mgnify:CR=1 FL=1|jgi:hypothetical protein